MDSSQTENSSPLLMKRGAAWDGIRLERYRFRAGDLPEHSHAAHLVTLSMSNGGCRGEIRTANGFIAREGQRGSACVIPSGEPFAARLEGEAEYLAIYLEPALVWRAAAESRAKGAVEVVGKCSPHDTVIRSVGLALLAEMEGGGLSGRLYAEALANVLAVHLLRHYTATGAAETRATGGLSGRRLRRVTDFIADNYARELTLAELSSVAGMSPFHFTREFKRTTGTTPHQYLIKRRIERAKTMLAESELPLVEVGSQAGFSHQSHFTRLFRRLTGTTPQSYRLMAQS